MNVNGTDYISVVDHNNDLAALQREQQAIDNAWQAVFDLLANSPEYLEAQQLNPGECATGKGHALETIRLLQTRARMPDSAGEVYAREQWAKWEKNVRACEKEIREMRALLERKNSAMRFVVEVVQIWQLETKLVKATDIPILELKAALTAGDPAPESAPAPESGPVHWKCPHCGSDKGTWYSRSSPMGNMCEACGENVDIPEPEPDPKPEPEPACQCGEPHVSDAVIHTPERCYLKPAEGVPPPSCLKAIAGYQCLLPLGHEGECDVRPQAEEIKKAAWPVTHQCPYCGKHFVFMSQLRKHQRQAHDKAVSFPAEARPQPSVEELQRTARAMQSSYEAWFGYHFAKLPLSLRDPAESLLKHNAESLTRLLPPEE